MSDCGMIYVLKSGPYYKIGKSATGLERPMSIINRMNNVEPRLPHYTDMMAQFSCFRSDLDFIERYLHQRFSGKRRNGEWFELSKADLLWMLEQDEVRMVMIGWNDAEIPLDEIPVWQRYRM